MARKSSAISRSQLHASQDRFVQAWGQLGPSWGISRTMAEAHALLFICGRPLNTDEVMDRLRISRGNASMTLRALVEWGIVSRVHKPGDRKEYFTAEQDVWSLARQIIRERLRREILPVLASLHEIRDATRPDAPASVQVADGATDVAGRISLPQAPSSDEVARHNERIDSLLELITMLDRLAERFVGSEGKGLRVAASLLSKIM